MEKKELGVGQYVTTGTTFIRGEFKPEETKIALSEQGKAAILEYLTESDKFHKLVCDITGVERKQEKVSPELEKLKEDYSHMCENYEHEKQKRNDFIQKSEKLQCKLDEVTKQNSKLIEEMERLKKCYQIQTELSVEYDKRCEKLQSKLNKASKRYGELIKTISDRTIKSV